VQNTTTTTRQLPSALTAFDRIAEQIKGRRFILCLDYDGTLTPIVQDYTRAIITPEMRDLVHQLARKIPVAIISGRDVTFIREHMQLQEAYYAGSHGFEITGPDGYSHELEEANAALPVLARAEEEMKAFAPEVPGMEIERKKFAMAVHFRKMKEELQPVVRRKVDEVLATYPQLKSGKGKMIIELKPAINWHKGKALETIVQQLDPRGEAMVAFIGDDVTDEDAFRVLKEDGLGIFVGMHDEPTAANYRLEDVEQVGEFLRELNRLW
jgi:trehalose 6-phosphate phosphatase